MNPYTQTLLSQVDYPQLAAWVEDWDRLEALVIRVYKGEAASPADEDEYRLLRARLQTAYPTWQAAF
ncbi:MAG TPA: hypothetical protein VLS48_05800, partial [Anaerolineales bacterium]|nr:hypothetical protein [Anaerolineales bacterium]